MRGIGEALVWIGAACSLLPGAGLILRDSSGMAASGPSSYSGSVIIKTVIVFASVCAALYFARRGSAYPRSSGLAVVGASLIVLIAGCLGLYNVLLAPTAALFLVAGLLLSLRGA
jgi:hypothetical protein